MLFGLISNSKKFELENSLIHKIVNSNIDFDNLSNLEDFNSKFFRLFYVELFRPSLNAIITKIKHGEAKFKVSLLKSWDRVAGHCVTATTAEMKNESVFLKKNYIISIKSIEPSIIMHEIAHAIEHISELDISGDFKKNLEIDIRKNNTNNIQVSTAIKTILFEELKNYELTSINSELFARFFELIALSIEVDGLKKYQYNYQAISTYFDNTIKYITNVLNPILLKNIDGDVFKNSNEYCKYIKKYEKKWTSGAKYSKFTNGKKWSDNIQSNNSLNDKEIEEVINSFNNWRKNKTVHKLDDGTEYYLFEKNK